MWGLVLTALSKNMGKLSFMIYVQEKVEALIYDSVLYARRFREVRPARSASRRKQRKKRQFEYTPRAPNVGPY